MCELRILYTATVPYDTLLQHASIAPHHIIKMTMIIPVHIKTHDSESQGQEEAQQRNH